MDILRDEPGASRRFGLLFLAALAAVPALVGCPQDEVCCTEFKPGAQVDVNISGSAQARVAAQAFADVGGLTASMVVDVTGACRNIAVDLGADEAARTAAEAKTDTDALKAWCDLAVAAIGTVKASATISVVAQPPECHASISAKAKCQAQCSVDGKCDVKANPPKCTGGRLEVACKGDCSITAEQPKITCEGKCAASCTGRCAASATAPTVRCQGKCNGTCSADAEAGGPGIQADGTCNGRCDGTCEITPGSAGVECEGSCQGECTGTCSAEGGIAAKCSGACSVDAEPLQCTGGKLEGGCQVDAKCDANCDASVKAEAECTPPRVTVNVAGASNAAAVVATLEANLPLVFRAAARLEGLKDLAATIGGNLDGIADIKIACIPVIAAAGQKSLAEIDASVSASGSVIGSVK